MNDTYKVGLYIPRSLFLEAQKRAKEEGTSVSQVVRKVLESYVAGKFRVVLEVED